jgi:hypothetical protein
MEVFCYLQTNTIFIIQNTPLAAIFYSLPMIAEYFNKLFLQFVSLTFTEIFSVSH